jgi:hypothetical protein
MSWQNQLQGDSLTWLLEPDPPGVRYLAMRDLLDYPDDDPNLLIARKAAHTDGPIAAILDEMDETGYWMKPGPGYGPKYRSSVWSAIMLAQLGASVQILANLHPRVLHLGQQIVYRETCVGRWSS